MRLLAALFLAALPVYFGFSLGRDEVRRTRTLSGFLELLLHVRYEITAYLTRRADLFLQFECEALRECGVLERLAAAHREGSDNPLYTLLSDEEFSLGLSGEDRRLLCEYARRLGECDAAEEIARTERVYALLSEKYETQKKESQRAVRLYRAFGVVVGLCVLLFVW